MPTGGVVHGTDGRGIIAWGGAARQGSGGEVERRGRLGVAGPVGRAVWAGLLGAVGARTSHPKGLIKK
jgi:hypothetical protein